MAKRAKLNNGRFLVLVGAFALVSAIAILLFSSDTYLRTQALNKSCECSSGHSLVCSDDGHTYTSYCEGSCGSKDIVHLGECY